MPMIFQGLNSAKRSIGNFSIVNNIDDGYTDLNNYYLTFEAIYYLNKDRIVYIYDFVLEKFSKLEFFADHLKMNLIDATTNSLFLWTLMINEESQQFELLQFKKNLLVERIKLNYNLKEITPSNLIIEATDINVYVFQNCLETGLKCIYEHKNKHELSKKDLEFESKLNESAISCLPLNKILINEKISQFASGKEHILMLTERSNKVYSFGIGLKGQLGHGIIENLFEPKLIDNLNKIVKITAGGWHSGALDDKGQIYLWGWNSEGQIGIENSNAFITTPTKLGVNHEFTNEEVKFRSLSLGARHSALIDIENNLYAFGWNKYGQLFNQNNKFELKVDEDSNIEEPMLLISYKKITKDIKCSNWFSLIHTY